MTPVWHSDPDFQPCHQSSTSESRPLSPTSPMVLHRTSTSLPETSTLATAPVRSPRRARPTPAPFPTPARPTSTNQPSVARPPTIPRLPTFARLPTPVSLASTKTTPIRNRRLLRDNCPGATDEKHHGETNRSSADLTNTHSHNAESHNADSLNITVKNTNSSDVGRCETSTPKPPNPAKPPSILASPSDSLASQKLQGTSSSDGGFDASPKASLSSGALSTSTMSAGPCHSFPSMSSSAIPPPSPRPTPPFVSDSAIQTDTPQSPVHSQLEQTYSVGRKLGRGCFATVYKAIRRRDQFPVAIKVVEKNRLDDETATLLDNELQILLAVSRHPGIVTLLDHIETDSHMCFVMNYVDGGPLLDRIVSRGSFSENDARILLRTILYTLQFLSQLGCVHRDIKPENILVDNHSHKWPVKLTDFGLSAKMQPDKLLYAALGTPLFVAPEILNGSGYDCSCDMWSLGVVMYIVLCGYPPFPFNETPSKLITAIVNGRYEFPEREWNHVSNDAKDVVRRMLEVNPTKRITPSEALQHRWVLQSQSTSDLPNRNLKAFNARRKLKGSVFAVRTFGLMSRLAGGRDSSPGGTDRREELQRDVERCRKLIVQMGMSSSNGRSFIRRPEESTGKSLGTDSVMARQNRKSLVLPMGQLGTLQGSSLWKGSTAFVPLYPSNMCTSQVMQSRAKDLLAEVDETTQMTDTTNPFMESTSTSSCNTPNCSDGSNDTANVISPQRGPLPQLDFGLLDM